MIEEGPPDVVDDESQTLFSHWYKTHAVAVVISVFAAEIDVDELEVMVPAAS